METLDFTRQLARQAGQLLLDFYRKDGLEKRLKSDRTVVTEADLAADALIARAIHDQFPGEAILSEELQPALGPGPSDELPVWIVDPLDGTRNFSLGLPLWGTLITRYAGGQPDTTALYFPVLDELYTAQRDQGAACNEQALRVEPQAALPEGTVFYCSSGVQRRYRVDLHIETRMLGCAGYALCHVARHGALSLETRTKIWDISGPWLVLEEAGACIETLDGSRPFPLRSQVAYASQGFPVLAAASPEILAYARQRIQPLPA